MIKHVVCFRLKDPQAVNRWLELSAPLKDIETVKNFAAAPLLKTDRFHCALYMDFDDEAGLQYYQVHPTHQQYVKESMPPLVEEKLVVDLKL